MKTTVESGDGIAVAHCGDVLLVLWKAPSSMPRFYWLEEQANAAAERGSFVMCQVILASSDPPDAEMRSAARETERRIGTRMRRLVLVPVGNALWMSIVRTIMRSIAVLSGQAKTHTYASNAADALEHIAAVATDRTPPREELAQSLLDLCMVLDVPARELGDLSARQVRSRPSP